MFYANALATGPVQQCGADVFRPVIAADRLRLSTPDHDLRQYSDHSMRWRREVHLDAQRLAVEVIDYIESPDATPIFELVMQEARRPDLVADLGLRQR